MKLIDLLSVISDKEVVYVVNGNGEPLSYYNGNDGIDTSLDDCEVMHISTYSTRKGTAIVIEIAD